MGIPEFVSSFTAAYPNEPASVRVARLAVIAFARNVGFDGLDLLDIEIAVGEALSNAAEHGHAPGAMIDLSVSFDGAELAVEVKDRGRGFLWSKSGERYPTSMRGFGLQLMRKLMDRVQHLDGGTRVILTKRIS